MLQCYTILQKTPCFRPVAAWQNDSNVETYPLLLSRCSSSRAETSSTWCQLLQSFLFRIKFRTIGRILWYWSDSMQFRATSLWRWKRMEVMLSNVSDIESSRGISSYKKHMASGIIRATSVGFSCELKAAMNGMLDECFIGFIDMIMINLIATFWLGIQFCARTESNLQSLQDHTEVQTALCFALRCPCLRLTHCRKLHQNPWMLSALQCKRGSGMKSRKDFDSLCQARLCHQHSVQ